MAQRGTPIRKRTVLTLPADSMQQARKIAHARRVNLSTVISEIVTTGLRAETARQRRSEILENYRKAFSGFTDEELAILDGVILEPVSLQEGS